MLENSTSRKVFGASFITSRFCGTLLDIALRIERHEKLLKVMCAINNIKYTRNTQLPQLKFE